MISFCSWNPYELLKDKELNKQELKTGHVLSLEKILHRSFPPRWKGTTSCAMRIHKRNACIGASHFKFVLASTNMTILGFGKVEHNKNYVNSQTSQVIKL